MTRKNYLILNAVFIALILGIFLYCYFMHSFSENITCIHHKYLGIDCPSCGLTRSFSALLHHDYTSALEWNRFGFRIFLFFVVQLGLRGLFLLLVLFQAVSLKIILKTDWILSSVLFLVCFFPFIATTFYLFYKMLFTGNVNF